MPPRTITGQATSFKSVNLSQNAEASLQQLSESEQLGTAQPCPGCPTTSLLALWGGTYYLPLCFCVVHVCKRFFQLVWIATVRDNRRVSMSLYNFRELQTLCLIRKCNHLHLQSQLLSLLILKHHFCHSSLS